MTDLVTVGSPLTHGEYLLTLGVFPDDQAQEFEARKVSRGLLVSPPRFRGRRWPIDVPPGRQAVLHHAGVFALTRWSNLYFEVDELLWGDAIGGPVAPVLGPGIADVAVKTGDAPDFFAHVLYWDIRKGRDAPHLNALRAAINLEDI